METKNITKNLSIILALSMMVVSTTHITGNAYGDNVTNNLPEKSQQINMIEDSNPGNPDFIYAANQTINGVVHVKTIRERDAGMSPLEFFFGPREEEREPEPDEGIGSGVIITDDGYIVTNHHVIAGADEIEVTLHDQRTYIAEVIGSDPNTDIAVLKINETGLDYINIGNSDDLEVGEWVLAVGNPFGLTSSVTAGIISAKERSLGVLQEGEMPIESFLQTDAAVNVGNSGGALVNLSGELVGIPTLIISPTGTDIGTAFAVPSSIVRRVKEDLIEYGEVRRGILGVSISEVTSEVAKEKGLEEIQGVYVEGVIDGGAADQAGIQSGDIIVEIKGNMVDSPSILQQEIARHQPGERVEIALIRAGNRMNMTAELLSMESHRELVMQQEETLLGATFGMVPEELKEQLGLPGGVQVTEIENGPFQALGMEEGFIILGINNQLVSEPAHVRYLLEDYSGNVVIEGVYPDGTPGRYAFSI